jgi:hypothetical protein
VQVSENVEFSANLRFPKPIVSCADERYHSHIENILNFFGAVYLAILHNEKINPKFIVNVKKKIIMKKYKCLRLAPGVG